MAIKINANMALGSAQYLDDRQSVADLDALLALDTNIIPNGFECYVEALDCKYKYHEDYNETSTGHWKLSTGGEGHIELTQAEYDALSEDEKMNGSVYFITDAEGDGGGNVYTSLAELELTADATFQDLIDALPKGCSALLGVKDFTNYQTIFPYAEGNDQFARVYIVKGIADGSSVYARWFRKDGAKEAIAKFNINDNKFNGWEKVATRTITTLAELGLTSSATVDDVHNKLAVGQVAILSVQAFDNYQTLFPYTDSNDQYARVEIQKGGSVAHSRIFWWRKNGLRFAIGNISSNNKLDGWSEYALKSYVDSEHKYSTSEVAIGTWIDGKTIYRKTFTKSPSSNQATGNQVTIEVATISGLTNVIDIQATAKLANYNNTNAPIYAKIPFGEMWRSTTSSSAAYVDSVYVEGTTLKIHANNCVPEDIYYVTVEYTK